MDYIYRVPSPLGELTLCSDGEALTGLWIHGQRHFGSTLPGGAAVFGPEPFTQTLSWLERFFSGYEPGFLPPLRLVGSPFAARVWNELLEIPYGGTVSYGDIARRIAEETGRAPPARAVGGAVGRNPISVIVPCHRVIRSDGAIGGYAAGEEAKRFLLALERGTLENGRAR